jgi:hypothetical protein
MEGDKKREEVSDLKEFGKPIILFDGSGTVGGGGISKKSRITLTTTHGLEEVEDNGSYYRGTNSSALRVPVVKTTTKELPKKRALKLQDYISRRGIGKVYLEDAE